MKNSTFYINILRFFKKDLPVILCVWSLLILGTGCIEKEKDIRHLKEITNMRRMALKKEHHIYKGFKNPYSDADYGEFWRVLSWKLFHKNHFKYLYNNEKKNPVSVNWEKISGYPGLSVTFLKHASIIIKDVDEYIFVDPVFFDIFWFIKDFTPIAFDLEKMPHPDHVLITHGHYDHLDKKSLSLFNKNTHILTPLGYNKIFEKIGLMNRTQLDWYETYVNQTREMTLLPSNHWSMRNPIKGPNRSLWGSYFIKTKSGFTIYIAGDTAFFNGFSELGKEIKIDLAIFNLSAYEPRWFMAKSHMNPEETIRAFKDLKAKHMMIVHWGTFRLGDEPVYLPPVQFKEALEREGLISSFIDIKHGQTLFYDGLYNQVH